METQPKALLHSIMAKYLLAILAYVLCIYTLMASQTSLSYGAKMGPGLSMHYGTKSDGMDYEVSSSYRLGMVVGGFLDLNISDNFALGYEVLYAQKGSDQEITIYKMVIQNVEEELAKPAVMNVSYYMDYIEIPVLLKVKVLNKPSFGMNAITGTAMALKVKGKHNLDGRVYFPDGDSFTELSIKDSSNLSDVNMFDFSFVYGGSVEYKRKNTYFLEYRFTLGWDYLSLPTYTLMPPVELRNQSYSLLLGMKF